jgi:hypothetical protein
MHHFASAASLGVAPAFVTLGIVYALFMLIGAAIVRVPAANWSPAGYVPAAASRLITTSNVDVRTAVRTPQFYLLWAMLFLNVTAGIGVLSQASPMIQEMFKGSVTPLAAAGFVGLLSLFNMGGRFIWASTSDLIGRKNTYFVFFLLGLALYACVPSIAREQKIVGFVLCYGIILSMYGGGFATIPAYLKDLFGTRYVGAIHGRLLTAWSAAGVLGPVLVDYIRQYQIHNGVAKADAYSVTMYIMAGLLFLGALCNLAVGPVSKDFHQASTAAAE